MSEVAGGLAQARQVFLQGCGLPEAWAGRAQWRVLETGFGPGLNFLATWHAWRSDPLRPRLLHFASVEASPLSADDLLRGLAPWPELRPLAEQLAAQWQGLVPGFHRLAFEGGQVLLTLCVGGVLPMLREQDFRADALFLDGFDSSRHEEIGSLATLKALTRLGRRGARLAARMANEQLRRELQSCGWQVEHAGPAPERPSLAARYEPSWLVPGLQDERPVQVSGAVVLGAGLAGAAVAASLARRGWSVQVLDAASGPASGASALPAGLLAPHQSPDDNLLSRLSRAGVRITLEEARHRLAQGLEWEPTGTLEWRGDDDRPPPALGDALAPWTREASAAQKRAAGLAEDAQAWWHANAAWIEPAALVRSWLRTPGVRFVGGQHVARIAQSDAGWALLDATGNALARAPLVIVAGALGTGPLLDGALALHPVRGQVSWAPREEADADCLPPFPVNGHGHFLPRVPLVDRGAWITGSTYGRRDADTGLRAEDDAANLQRVSEVLPHAAQVAAAAQARGALRSWSGVRCTSSDRRPLVGELAPGLWASTAMGSRGLTFAAMCAELVAARLHGEPLPLEARLARALDLSRQAGPARSG